MDHVQRKRLDVLAYFQTSLLLFIYLLSIVQSMPPQNYLKLAGSLYVEYGRYHNNRIFNYPLM